MHIEVVKIKKTVLDLIRLATVTVVLATVSACGGSSSPSPANSNLLPFVDVNQPGNTIPPAGIPGLVPVGGSWTLDDFLFAAHFSGATTEGREESQHIALLAGDNLFEPSNGDYHGSVLTIRFSANGSGNYVVTDSDSAHSAFASNVNVASLDVSAGVASGGTTRWDSTITSGNLTVTVNAEGRYFVSTAEPIVVTKAFELGSGIDGAPDQMSLEIRNISALPDEFE